MSDCAKCGKFVHVPDGYEFEEGDLCWTCTDQELDDLQGLADRLGTLLDATANALHGGPKENGLWSFHDLPDLADKAMNRIADLEECIRELIKGGEHEGECDNDPGMMNEGGACMKHCDASDAREQAARKMLEER
jgi:hypothetical protein